MKQLSFLLVLAALLFACKKQDEHPIHAGEYFHCKVDGRDWYASKDGDIFAPAVSGEFYLDTVLNLGAYSGIEAFGISIYANSIQIGSSYEVSDYTPYHSTVIYRNDLSTGKRYTTDSEHKGVVTITSIDYRKHIIEGTFQFVLYHPVKLKTINVTDGFFSIEYIPH